MWLDSGSISAQILLSKHMNQPQKARSLMKYMVKFALAQGLAFSAIVSAVGRFIPSVFTSDTTVTSLITQCIPHLAFQQTIVSICLVLEGLAIGGSQFRFTAVGTALSTLVGLWQMSQARSVVDIWARAVNTFFAMRLISAVLGIVRVNIGLGATNMSDMSLVGTDDPATLNGPPLHGISGSSKPAL
jgi:Na+-driven multidrug efflux pump